MNLNILQKAKKTDLILEPFPHLIIENALPDDIYSKLDNLWPEAFLSSDHPTLTDEKGHTTRYLSNPVLLEKIVDPLWIDFFQYHISQDFYRYTVDILSAAIKEYYPDHADTILNGNPSARQSINQNIDNTVLVTDCQFVQNKVLKNNETSRTAHLDNPQEIYAALFYMKKTDDHCIGRDLFIYECKDSRPPLGKKRVVDEQHIKFVKKCEYKANTAILFLNCRHGVHSVGTASNQTHVRRHINIIGEYGNGKNLFNL